MGVALYVLDTPNRQLSGDSNQEWPGAYQRPRAGWRNLRMSKNAPTTLEGIATDHEPPTCRHDSPHCPVDNPAVADTRLECWDCFAQLSRADTRPADAIAHER